MHWEKEICIRITLRRIVGACLAATIMANLVIVGVVFGAVSSPATPTPTPSLSPQPSVTPSVVTLAAMPSETTVPALPSSPTVTAAPTFTSTGTPTDLPTLSMCVLHSNWPVYYAKQGDTLDSLARAIGSSVNELMLANCLPDAYIYPGQLLYVPRLPPATPTPTSSIIPPAIPSDTATSLPVTPPTITLTTPPTYTPATLTVPPDVETVFLNPYGELSLCTNEFYVTVTASDPQGVRSVSAFYSVNGVEGSEISMQFDSGAYYGLTSMAGEFSTNDKVSFSFVAYDGLGIRSTSGTYSAVITSCLGLQQAKAHV